MIEGVIIKSLIKIPDERGCILPMIRSDSPEFTGFGEINFCYLFPGMIQGWNLYKHVTTYYAVVDGMVKLVLFDDRENSLTKGELQEIFLGDLKYCLVKVPNDVWIGYKGITSPKSLVVCYADMPINSSVFEKLESSSNQIPYQWGVKHG